MLLPVVPISGVRPPVFAVAVAAALSPVFATRAAPPDHFVQPEEDDLQIVAAAVRVTGARCHQPLGVERDAVESRPERPAWIIRCEEGLFRVIFEGDTGVRVTPVD